MIHLSCTLFEIRIHLPLKLLKLLLCAKRCSVSVTMGSSAMSPSGKFELFQLGSLEETSQKKISKLPAL